MRLSEAIRLGAMLHPQRFGSYATYRDERGRFCSSNAPIATIAATCALGAASAAGLTTDDAIDSPRFTCPACNWHTQRLALVIHLNDRHRWTRERIADWVESVERASYPVAESAEILSVE